MSLVTLLPLGLTLLVCLASAFYFVKRKSLAQTLCVQEAAQTQKELGESLRRLFLLNPKARVLRRERAAADHSLVLALAGANPAAIAAAKAAQKAVILAQSALKIEQERILNGARFIRFRHERELAARLKQLHASPLSSPRYFPHALAVKPSPPLSPSPDYEKAEPFLALQQQRFRFYVDFNFWELLSPPVRQRTECSVSLIEELNGGKGNIWQIQFLAASA